MIQFAIMAFILGFTTNKLFLKDKSNIGSVITGIKISIVLLVVKGLALI